MALLDLISTCIHILIIESVKELSSLSFIIPSRFCSSLGRRNMLAGFVALCFYLSTCCFICSRYQCLGSPKLVRNQISKLRLALGVRLDECLENPVKLLESGFLFESSGISLVAIGRVRL